MALCAFFLDAFRAAPPAAAAEFGDGALAGRIDTTLSHGVAFRLGERDDEATDVNSDDGDLNYDRGLISNTSKITSEIDLEFGNFGAFARFQGFIDFENRDGERERTPLSNAAQDRVGERFQVLDLYVAGAFDAGDVPIDARFGSQVLNWGESTYIQNGVNVINPFDVAKLRKPGAELRDGLLPVPMVSLSAAPSAEWSVEGFYQLTWKETEIDPSGTYFATNDYAAPGGSRAFIPLPGVDVSDTGRSFGPLTTAINADLAVSPGARCQFTSLAPPTFAGADCQAEFDPGFLSVPRAAGAEPRDSGQGGMALRYFAEHLGDTEFGFYFINHHSRLPLISAQYGSPAGYGAGLAAAAAVTAPGSQTIQGIGAAVTAQVSAQIRAAVETAVPPAAPNRDAVIAQQVAARLNSAETQQAIAAATSDQAAGVAQLLAIDRYGKTARYMVEYPEDLRVFGLSFNTQLGATGWALQGEYTFRPDAPLQRSAGSVFADGLAPIVAALRGDPAAAALRARLGTRLDGYVERDVSQIQATGTKVLGPMLGADGSVFVAEAAVMQVHDMPAKDETPLDTAGPEDETADATSFGYRAAARLDYNNAVGAARLSPYAQWQHDVSGSSPGPSGPFVEGRTTLTLGLRIGYLDRFQADLSYTRFGGDKNPLRGRDFLSVSATYAF